MKYNGIELEPITEVQAFSVPREMLCWFSASWPEVIKVSAIMNIYDSDEECWSPTPVDIDGKISGAFCAEIPKPKTRKMTSLEVMEYLHKLQLLCNGELDVDIELPKDMVGNFNFKYGAVVCNYIESTKGSWESVKNFDSEENTKDYFFGILKDGKVTEFELPEVEEKG